MYIYIWKNMSSQLYFKFQFNHIKLNQVFLLPFYTCNSLLQHSPLCLIYFTNMIKPTLRNKSAIFSSAVSPYRCPPSQALTRHTGHTPMQTHSSSHLGLISHTRLPSSKWGALFTPYSIRSPLL